MKYLINPILILLALFNLCCGNNHIERSNNLKDLKVVSNQDSLKTYMYDSGDVMTKGFLDKSGNMWFTTTKEGIYMYDGNTFTNYTKKNGLCGSQIWTVIESDNGLLWFGTDHGICAFDGKEFKNHPIPQYKIKTDWLEESYPIVNPNAVVSLFEDKNGIIWIGTNGNGIYKYDGLKFHNHLNKRGKLMPDGLHHNVVLSITEDNVGNVWFSSFSHGGVSQYNKGIFKHYALKDSFGNGMTCTLYKDKQGSIWAGTRNGGIYKFNGELFLNVKNIDKNNQIAMASFYEDRNGNFWVSSYARKGIYLYDGESFIPFTEKGSDNLIDIKFITEDKEGNIWFGGRYGSLWRYNGSELKDFTQLKRTL
jgi:ligand-binding sensor domain-containing protein